MEQMLFVCIMMKLKLFMACSATLFFMSVYSVRSENETVYPPSELFMVERENPLGIELQRKRYFLAKLLMPVITEDSLMAMPMDRAEALEAGAEEIYYDYVSDLVDAFNTVTAKMKPEIRQAFIDCHRNMRDRLEGLISLQYIYLNGRVEVDDSLNEEIARDIGFSNEAYVRLKAENQRVRTEFEELLEKYSRHVDIVGNINQIYSEAFRFDNSLFITPEVPLPGGGSYYSRQLNRELNRVNRKYSVK